MAAEKLTVTISAPPWFGAWVRRYLDECIEPDPEFVTFIWRLVVTVR